MGTEKILFSDELMHCLEDVDLRQENVEDVYREIKIRLAPLARSLQLARIVVTISISPDSFNLDGFHHQFLLVYSEDCAADEYSVESGNYNVLSGHGTSRMWPVKGHAWSEEEKRSIRIMSKLMFMMVSRSMLVGSIRRLSCMDVMTGLSNLIGLQKKMQQVHEQGRMDEYAICFFNLKSFKYFNQRFGGFAGDSLLKKYSLELYHFTRPEEETAARLGGDNFVVFLKKERMEAFLEYASQIEIPMELKGHETITAVPMLARYGVYYGEKQDTGETMLQNVTLAQKRAREEKLDVAYFQKEMIAHLVEGEKIAISFPKALKSGEIVPFYQPKVAVDTKRMCGAEALVRWFHKGKMLSPAEFLPSLERAGEIHDLDIYMLEAVCRDIRRWLDSGIEPVRVSVNFAKNDLVIPTIAQDTLAILAKYGLDGKYIEIELTELSSYDNKEKLQRFIEAMHRHNILVTMDDFGSGYSSLNFLKDTDFNIVKLDKSFVDQIEKHVKKDEIMLRGMVNMLKDIDVGVVAEGVETKEQALFVKNVHCNVIQGFYFDKPMPVAEFEQRLRQKSYDSEPGSMDS